MSDDNEHVEVTSAGAQIQNVGDGTLITFNNGATLWFDSRGDAALFGSTLATVAYRLADAQSQP